MPHCAGRLAPIRPLQCLLRRQPPTIPIRRAHARCLRGRPANEPTDAGFRYCRNRRYRPARPSSRPCPSACIDRRRSRARRSEMVQPNLPVPEISSRTDPTPTQISPTIPLESNELDASSAGPVRMLGLTSPALLFCAPRLTSPRPAYANSAEVLAQFVDRHNISPRNRSRKEPERDCPVGAAIRCKRSFSNEKKR